jgi:hypothetical protein
MSEKLESALQSQQAPEGYVLVPIEPTNRMWAAARQEKRPLAVWDAMIKAYQEETDAEN